MEESNEILNKNEYKYNTKEEEIKDRAQEGWRSTLSARGLSTVACAVRFHRRVWVSIKEKIVSICPTSVFIHPFHEPLSA